MSVSRIGELQSVPRPYSKAQYNGRSTFDLRSPANNMKSWTLGQEIERRQHRPYSVRAIFETCDVCNKKFGIVAQNACKCIGTFLDYILLLIVKF